MAEGSIHGAGTGAGTGATAAAGAACEPAVGTGEVGAWEAAYLRFQTPEEEIRKFEQRLVQVGARTWPRESRILELCCGRGNDLHALGRLGFRHLTGVDLSPRLAALYDGPGEVVVGDCRSLPFPDASYDFVIVQGGLHHLPALEADVDRTLAEARRVLRDGGRLVAIEPWLTPFLRIVHAASATRLARRLSPRVDAFATMVEHETPIYQRWLDAPVAVEAMLMRHFVAERSERAWGKLLYVGKKRPLRTSSATTTTATIATSAPDSTDGAHA